MTSTSEYNTNHFRSAFADGDGNFWGAGSYYGISYFGFDEPPSILQDALGNCRVLGMVAGGFLTFSTQTETPGIYIFETSTPTSPAAIALVIATGTASSPEDFIFAPDNSFAYVADDSAGGGIQRWQLSQGNWNLAYTLSSGVPGVGVRSLTANFSGQNPAIYAITAEATSNRLIAVTDSGPGSVVSTWATDRFQPGVSRRKICAAAPTSSRNVVNQQFALANSHWHNGPELYRPIFDGSGKLGCGCYKSRSLHVHAKHPDNFSRPILPRGQKPLVMVVMSEIPE